MKLSFIIPAYNASSTVVRTLDSIYNLPMREDEFEVIVVDDCSTDNTLSMLQDYASSRENMRVLHQEQNHRQGAARNWGVHKALGEYVMFVDSDDIVENGVCEAINYAKQKSVNILFGDYNWTSNDNLSRRHLAKEISGRIFVGSEFLETVYDVVFNTCPINYLWKRSFLQKTNIPFIEERRMEDIDWIEKHIIKSSSICYMNVLVYTVIGHPGSTTHTSNVGTISDWLHFSHRRYDFAELHKNELPQFYEKVLHDNPRFVIGNTRIRMLSNFSPVEIKSIYQNIGKETLQTLQRYLWPMQARLFINYPRLELVTIAVLHPITKIGRTIVRRIRKLCKNS